MTREEFADAFETLAKICREPKNPVHSSPSRIKRAVLASAYFGIHGLQTVLCVKSDGILGPITWEALEDINIDVLVAKILAHLIQHPMPSPVGIPPVGVPPVDPFPTPIPEPFPPPGPTGPPSPEPSPTPPPIEPTPEPPPTSPVPHAAEYAQYFSSMVIDSHRLSEIQGIAHKIQQGMSRYQTVAEAVGLTYWPLIGVIHNLESGCDFNTHLYNGDPLTARTVRPPVGRPTTGNPPFMWAFSAIDALRHEGFDKWHDWTIIGMAYMLEKYNGFGYRPHGVPSPYLWAGSSIYTKGFYTDSGFDPNLVSRQIGGMTMIRYFFDQGIVAP
jgi:lysozyme family protein